MNGSHANDWMALGSSLGIAAPARRRPAPMAYVGDPLGGALGATAYPWSLVEQFNADVEHLNTDITNWTQNGDPKRMLMLVKWQNMYMPWRAWFAQSNADLPDMMRMVVGDRQKQFDDYRRRFAELLRQFNALGIKSDIQSPDFRSPFERLIAFNPSGSGLPWWVPVGLTLVAVGIGLYLIGPKILLRLAART